MKVKNKKAFYASSCVCAVLLGLCTWLSLRPVEIVAIHNDGEFSSVLVKNFPLTNSGKINWWLKNKEALDSKYKIPNSDSDGSFTIVFWLFGDGYKEQGKYDRRCFIDMKTKENCIDKKRVFSVETGRNNDILFTVRDGIYRMNKKGEIVKYEY
ncbi:DUF943 family protein [Erwinia rhapontici]|uniref:DUF943 family protein n=2 Tax=Erwinia rhapontici TaxID=55212 RepID=UPI003B9FEF4F